MPTELGLDRGGNRLGFHCYDSLFEGLNHCAFAEPAKLAAIRARWPGRFLLRQRCKIGPTFKLGDQCLRFFLGFDKDMRGVEFGLGLNIAIVLFVGGLERLVG